MTMNNRAPI